MTFVASLRAGHWPTVVGFILFVGMLATGYYYNITFVQLGLVHLGTERIGMREAAVAVNMAALALLTATTAVAFGLLMTRRGWSHSFVVKLRLAFGVVLTQTILTAVAPFIRSEQAFFAWIVVASIALGVGVPTTFGLTVDLVPVHSRGYVAALVTALAYFVAAVFSSTWTIEAFARQIVGPMVLGTIGIGILAFKRFAFIDQLAKQHERPAFGIGRFMPRSGSSRIWRRRFLGALIFMFGIYFVDSLGFLRIIETPAFVGGAWHSPETGIRVFIGGTHVVAALIAGILYTALDERSLFLWIFGIFALVQMMYVFTTWAGPSEPVPLAMPLLYATAVSIYTVVNFALWADLSTPATIARNAALGVALSAWTATFLSTALSIEWRAAGVALDVHLNRVAAVAIVFFLGALAVTLMSKRDQNETV